MIRRILNTALSIATCALAIFCIFAVLSVSSGRAPVIFGRAMLIVKSGSMEPSLPVGSVLIAQRTDFDKIEPDDIIAFYSEDPSLNGAINTHRVISRDGDVLATKGDANSLPDNYTVSRQRLIGKIVFCSPFLGKVISVLKKPYVFLPLIILPLIWIIVSAALNIRKLLAQYGEDVAFETKQAGDVEKNDENSDK